MKEEKEHRYTSPPGSSPVPGLPQLCGCQGGGGGGQPNHLWGWQPRLTSEVLVGQFVLPKGDEVTGRCFSMLTELHTLFCEGSGSGW